MKTVVITKKMYGWSKWGGPTSGLVKKEYDVWHCQGCSTEVIKEMPQYMLPLDEDQREFARVCSRCKHQAVLHHIQLFFDLLKFVRKLSIYG